MAEEAREPWFPSPATLRAEATEIRAHHPGIGYVATMYDGAADQIERLREFVVAHTLHAKGIVDFDLHREAVERFERASESVADVIREALTEAENSYSEARG